MVNLLEELCPIPNIPEGGKALIGQLRGCAACGCTRLWRWTGPFPRARMVARARAHFEDPANVEAYRAEAASLAGADAPISDTWDEPAA